MGGWSISHHASQWYEEEFPRQVKLNKHYFYPLPSFPFLVQHVDDFQVFVLLFMAPCVLLVIFSSFTLLSYCMSISFPTLSFYSSLFSFSHKPLWQFPLLYIFHSSPTPSSSFMPQYSSNHSQDKLSFHTKSALLALFLTLLTCWLVLMVFLLSRLLPKLLSYCLTTPQFSIEIVCNVYLDDHSVSLSDWLNARSRDWTIVIFFIVVWLSILKMGETIGNKNWFRKKHKLFSVCLTNFLCE